MAERQKFVEQFYGEIPRYDVAVDFDRKAGPLGKMNQASIQTQKAEAGIGQPGEQVIRPGPPQPVPQPPPYSPPEAVPPTSFGPPPSSPPGSSNLPPPAPPETPPPSTPVP